MKTKKISFILFAFFISSMGVCAQPSEQGRTKVESISAILGKEIILQSDIDKQMLQFRIQNKELSTDKEEQCQVIERMLIEKLLANQADVDSLEISAAEVSRQVNQRVDYIQQQLGSKDKMEEFYNKSTLAIKNEMYGILEKTIKAQRMQQQIVSEIDATPYEVKNYYENLHTDSVPVVPEKVKLAEIVIYPKATHSAKQAVRDRLSQIKEDIEDGSSFKTKAILYSQDPGSASKGGVYNGIKRGQFVKQFDFAAFNLLENEISEPFETEYGFHIVQLLRRRGETLDLRHILIKPELDDSSIDEASLLLDSIKAKVDRGDLTFEEAVAIYSEEEASKKNKGIKVNPQSGLEEFSLENIDKEIYFAINGLEKGEVSKSSFFETKRGKQYFAIYKIIDKTERHRADYKKDFVAIKQQLIVEKKTETFEKWLQQKISDTYIKFDDDFNTCTNFQYTWKGKSIL